MALPRERTYTVEDIYNLPEGERAELIDGQIYYMAPPSSRHQDFVMELSYRIKDYIKRNNSSCKVYPAPFAVFIKPHDDRFYVEPDISVICDTNKIDKKGCKGAPDWIIEITSPSTASYDYVKKLNLYADYGVKEYWIVNPQNQAVIVYHFETGILAQSYTFQNKVKVNIYDDFVIDFSELNS